MPLLNYTTSISADKTVAEIHRMLAKAGAKKIMSDYDDNGYIVALSFAMDIEGQQVGFQLPTDWRPVLQILERDRKVPRSLKTQEQALKVGWRITKDWVEAQLAIIETRMVKTEQVFLPYMVGRDGKTLYETFESNPSLMLGGGQDGQT